MNNQNDNSTKLCAFASALDSSYGEALQLKAHTWAQQHNLRHLRVTCGILRRGATFFCARRGAMLGMAGKWEFPGGKIEPQETPEACIVREIKEELQVTAQVERFLGIAVYAYPDFVLELYVFVLTLLLASEPVLIEHSAGAWRTALELSKLPWDECDSLFVPLLKDYHPF